MQQFFLIALVILGIATAWLYNENQTLKENNVKLEIAIHQQEEAMAAIKESYEKQGQSLLIVRVFSAQYQKSIVLENKLDNLMQR